MNNDVYEGKQELPTVPERRPLEKQSRVYTVTAESKERETAAEEKTASTAKEEPEASKTKPKLWYCKQCGYVVFRDDPPYVCPICKAKREMFAEIKTRIDFIG